MKKPGAPAMAHANSQRINVVATLFGWTYQAPSLATAPGVKFALVRSTRAEFRALFHELLDQFQDMEP
jgi:hypothetical protein